MIFCQEFLLNKDKCLHIPYSSTPPPLFVNIIRSNFKFKQMRKILFTFLLSSSTTIFSFSMLLTSPASFSANSLKKLSWPVLIPLICHFFITDNIFGLKFLQTLKHQQKNPPTRKPPNLMDQSTFGKPQDSSDVPPQIFSFPLPVRFSFENNLLRSA